jgi:hypothetical protein
MADHGRHRFQAEIVIAGHALVAVHAAIGVPAHADTLPDLQSLDVLADGDDSAYRFVPRYDRVLGQTLIVVDSRKIGMAKATVFDGDFYFFRPKRAGAKGVGFERLLCAARGPSANIRPRYSPLAAGK